MKKEAKGVRIPEKRPFYRKIRQCEPLELIVEARAGELNRVFQPETWMKFILGWLKWLEFG